MYGYFEGYSDAEEIKFCPYCGEEIYIRISDGSAECTKCGSQVAVIYTVSPEEMEKGGENGE